MYAYASWEAGKGRLIVALLADLESVDRSPDATGIYADEQAGTEADGVYADEQAGTEDKLDLSFTHINVSSVLIY
ncbi:hypothetical protein ACOSQ3_004854 [Xanthoceras sorbifolium]